MIQLYSMDERGTEVILNTVDSIVNRCVVINILIRESSYHPSLLHTLLEDIAEDVQDLLDEFCVEESNGSSGSIHTPQEE